MYMVAALPREKISCFFCLGLTGIRFCNGWTAQDLTPIDRSASRIIAEQVIMIDIHIGRHIPLNSNNECSLGSGKGRQITSFHKDSRQNISKKNSAAFGKTVEKKNDNNFFCVFWKNGGEFFKLFFCCFWKSGGEIEVPSRVDGKRRNLAWVSDFVSWDEACRVPRHKITHECKIPPLSIHEW